MRELQDAGLTLSETTEAGLEAVLALLTEAELPHEGLMDGGTRVFSLRDRGGLLVGAIAYEDYHPFALVRSLVVAPAQRGNGYGRALVRFVLTHLAARGFTAAYALTTTIPEMLLRMGFSEIARDDVPEPVHASAELRGACPQSARVFVCRPA